MRINIDTTLFGAPYVDIFYTPVYRLARFTGELPPEERLVLTAAQRIIGGDEAKGARLGKEIGDHTLTSGKLTRLLAELAEGKMKGDTLQKR